MKIEIDQSGKLEDTHKPTVISFSGEKDKTLIIFSTEKQKTQKYFRKINKPTVYVYVTFAILICLLLKNERSIGEIVIDREYPGKEPDIKNYLLQFLRKSGREMDKRDISFHELGKEAKAHKIAISSYRKKRANLKIKFGDILNFLAKIKSGVW